MRQLVDHTISLDKFETLFADFRANTTSKKWTSFELPLASSDIPRRQQKMLPGTDPTYLTRQSPSGLPNCKNIALRTDFQRKPQGSLVPKSMSFDSYINKQIEWDPSVHGALCIKCGGLVHVRK